MDRNRITRYILTGSLVFVFGLFGIQKFTDSFLWIGFIPNWLDGMLGMTKEQWLQIIGAIEILSAVALLVPMRNVKQVGATAIIVQLLGILSQVAMQDGFTGAMFVRDVSILLQAMALLVLL